MFHADNILNGETAEIIWSGNVFPPRPILRYFDIGVNYDDFSRQIWHGFDLYNYDEITLHAEGHDVIFKP